MLVDPTSEGAIANAILSIITSPDTWETYAGNGRWGGVVVAVANI